MKRSRLVLGTVQLGMQYGLSNTTGQPTNVQAFEILDAAWERGINTFDTAHAYGSAEDVLGAWIAERGHGNDVFVITKLKPHALEAYPQGTKAEDVVAAELQKSLERLQLKKVDGYLLHTPAYVFLPEVITALRAVQKKGLADNIGVSIYNEREALHAVDIGLDYIQVPYNALDLRLDRTDFWDTAKKNNVTVFARSPFLQGLLLMEPNNIPAHLSYARPYIEQFRDIAQKSGLTPSKAALLFSFVRSKAQHIVVGAETTAQIAEDVAIIEGAKEESWMRDIEESFKDIEQAVVNPSLWSKT